MHTLTATSPIQLIRDSGHAEAYHNLRKERDRENVLDKLAAIQAIAERCQAGEGRGKAVQSVAKAYRGRRGFSPAKLAADYNLYQRGGQKRDARGKLSGPVYAARDWRVFLPAYTNGDCQAALTNAPFVKYIQRLFADTCREDATGNALHERLLDNWFSGDDIPGYGTLSQWCAPQGRPVPHGPLARSRPENRPSGWSPDNLRRMLPSDNKRVYIQRGEHAAHSSWGDQLLRDRSKLMPFQLVTFDDVRFDLKVIQPIPGKAAQVVAPEAIFALDVGTGMILAKAVLGTYTRDADGDGGKAGTRRAFQHADMRWLMTKMLEQYGLPESWQMHVLLENASASMSAADQQAFERLTGIRFDKTGLIRQKLTASGFVEQGGMPWQKGWVEALFRLVHTRINHLPGAIGRRYDLTDGRQAQQERYTLKTLLSAHEKGIPISELSLPILTIDEFHVLLDEYVARINWRINHRLQGFQEVYELGLPDGRHLRHDDPMAAQLMTVGTQLSARMEAPAERFARLLQGHSMRPAHPRELLPLSMDKKPVTVAAERVTISQRGRDPLVFRDVDTAHHLAQWNGRAKALLGFISSDESQIHLFTNDGDLTYICSPRRVGRIDITDEKAVLARAGEVHRGREEVRHYAADLMADQEIDLRTMREHNTTRLAADLPAAIEQAEGVNKARRIKEAHTFERASTTTAAQARANRRDADLARAAANAHDEDDY